MPRLLAFTGLLPCLVTGLTIAFSIPGDALATDDSELRAYAEMHDGWRQDRITFLKGPNGYLNLAGLYWLREGTHSFGSASDNDLVFPPAAPAVIGELSLHDGVVRMRVQDGVEVEVNGAATGDVTMSDDRNDAPVVATHGSIAWTIIRRDDQYAVRVRDFEHAALAEFESPEYYPLDIDMRLIATFIAYDAPRVVRVNTVIEGLEYKPQAPGLLRFEIESTSYELEAYAAGDKLFLVFADETSGRDTYPAGRFLYAELPDENGATVLDFNKAHNPPCAYNDFATCPVASPRNRLRTGITAGERYDRAAHSYH